MASGCSTCWMARRRFSAPPSASRATSPAAFSRIAKATSGLPARGDWTGFESCRSLRFGSTEVPVSELTNSVVASNDGSVWVAAGEGVTRWKDGRFRYFKNDHGMPATGGQALFADHRRTRLGEHIHGARLFRPRQILPRRRAARERRRVRSRETWQAISGSRAPESLLGFKTTGSLKKSPGPHSEPSIAQASSQTVAACGWGSR